MPSTVDAAFSQFLDGIRATPTETQAAANHRESIRKKLEADFGMTAFFRTGSFGNGTNVSGFSDVDYFAVIPTANLKQNSSRSLEQVADSLRERFPLTGVRMDSPGVRIPFGLDGAEATEVVPVDATGITKLGFRQFDIPDGNGGWKFSAPESHNAYVAAIDNKHAGRVKPLIRFLKAWKFERIVPIKSFYLELRVAKYADGESAIIYDIDIRNVLRVLLSENLADFSDPRFPYDNFFLTACSTDLVRRDALSKLENAYRWANEAVSFRLAEKQRAAFEQWALVFNYEFPEYAEP